MRSMYAILIIFSALAAIAICLAIYGGKIDKTMDSVSLYRVASCLVVGSILSAVISLYAIVYSLSGGGSSFITSQDAIVDILGILVTVLMGWNIISLVDFKKKADEIDYIKHDFENVISGFMQLNFDSFITKGEDSEVLDNCFSALDEIHSCLNESIRQMAEGKLMAMIKCVCYEMSQKGDYWIIPNKKNHYLHSLSHVDNKYTQDVIDFLNKTNNVEHKLNPNGDGDNMDVVSGSTQ